MMNKWLIIHSSHSYIQHDNMIGCEYIRYRTKIRPKFKPFSDIKKGDEIVYYAKGKKLVGIFKIISNIEYLKDDPKWGNVAVYYIKPKHVPENPLYIDELIQNKDVIFDLFKNKKYWGSYLQGKIIKKLTEHDFKLFSNFIKDQTK